MAVSGKTSTYQVPYFLDGDKPPDMAAVTKAIAERVETLLAKGGDVSIAADGTITIGAKKVVTGMIADALKPSAGAAAGAEALRALGASGSTAAAGNDSRLSDERTPKANSVNSGKIQDGTVADTDLASPNNSAYRTVAVAQQMAVAAGGGTFIFANNGLEPVASGGKLTGVSLKSVPFFYFDDADHAVAGKTQKLRIRAQIIVNTTKPGIKFSVGLYPVSAAGGGTNELTMTLGAVVGGSTVDINDPASSSVVSQVGADFAAPADGIYVPGFVTSGAMAANSAVLLSAQIQTHSV